MPEFRGSLLFWFYSRFIGISSIANMSLSYSWVSSTLGFFVNINARPRLFNWSRFCKYFSFSSNSYILSSLFVRVLCCRSSTYLSPFLSIMTISSTYLWDSVTIPSLSIKAKMLTLDIWATMLSLGLTPALRFYQNRLVEIFLLLKSNFS